MCGLIVLPAVGAGGVWDQHGADWSDPHALIDDAVQVRQPTAIWHAYRSFTAHLLIQLLLHALLDLEGVGTVEAHMALAIHKPHC